MCVSIWAFAGTGATIGNWRPDAQPPAFAQSKAPEVVEFLAAFGQPEQPEPVELPEQPPVFETPDVPEPVELLAAFEQPEQQ